MKALFLVTAPILLAATAHAGDVEILVVGESKPYAAAAHAAAVALGGDTKSTVLPQSAPLPAAWQLAPPPVVIAVGARAVRLALTLPNTKVVAAMVLQESPELQNARVRTVALAVPVERQLALLARLAPAARRVGLVVDPRHSAAVTAEARAAATQHGLELVVREVSAEAEVATTFALLLQQVDALLLVADTTVVKREVLELLVERSHALRRPVIGYSAAVVQSGLLAGYAVEPDENGAAAAAQARALAAGLEPKGAQLQGQLHLNAKCARTLGLTVPRELLAHPTIVHDPR